MKTLFKAICLALLAMLAPLAQAQQAGVLKRGDLVVIELKTPLEDVQSVSSKYVVSERGTIKMPMLEHEISALGITPDALARNIERAYVAAGIYTAPTLTANLPEKEMPTHVVTVSGEVRLPQEIPLREGLTLMGAITKAGGFGDFANTKKVKLLRGNNATYYDMRKINSDGSNNPYLKDGDLIIVPQ
jgi:polysaccharide export outer membrane protein